MKDKILDWLGVIKDEDAHLYEEYIPTKEEKRKEAIIQYGITFLLALLLIGWPFTYYRILPVRIVYNDDVLKNEGIVFSHSFIARHRVKVGDLVLVEIHNSQKIYGTVYEMDKNNITIEDGGVARISVPKEQMISVKVNHPYSKIFGWMIMKSRSLYL